MPNGVAATLEEEQEAARLLRAEQLMAQRQTQTDTAAERAKTQAAERARKELVQKISKRIFRGAKVGTGVTLVGLIITFAIMNLQLLMINVMRGGEPIELGGLMIPKLDQWEVILVIVIDLLAIVANPVVLGIIFFVTLAPSISG